MRVFLPLKQLPVAIRWQWPGGEAGENGIKKIFGTLNHNKVRAGTAGSSQLFLIHSNRNFSLSLSLVLHIFCFVSFHELIKADYAAPL